MVTALQQNFFTAYTSKAQQGQSCPIEESTQ